MKKVAIIMGSASDLPVVEKAIDTLEAYGIPHEVHVYSAHRTPVEAKAFAENAREAGFGVLICAAGKAAHLAGAIAANTTLPVAEVAARSGFSSAQYFCRVFKADTGFSAEAWRERRK